jgi:hypothetical protein
MTDKKLTAKEQKAVDALEAARPGTGKYLEQSIRANEITGTADIINSTADEDLVITEGISSNSFMYKRIG